MRKRVGNWWALIVVATVLAVAGPARAEQVSLDITGCHDIYGGDLWSAALDGRETQVLLAPDQNAIYWIVTLPVLPADVYGSGRIELRGGFPDARFMSFTSYNTMGVPIDQLDDQAIAADPGSINPHSEGIPYPADGTSVNYTLTLTDVPVAQQVHTEGDNALFGGWLPATGELLEKQQVAYRVYLPTDPADQTAGVGMPRIVYVYDTGDVTAQTPTTYEEICDVVPDEYELLGRDPAFLEPLEEFADASAPMVYAAPRADVPGFHPQNPPEWFVGASFAQIIDQGFPIFPDGQIPGEGEEGIYLNYSTKYIATFLDPDRAFTDLAVVRIKAPRTPMTETGEAVDPQNDQVRYWSVCIHQMSNLNYLWGCVHDNQFQRDPGSPDQITIVFANESDRPAGLCNPLEEGGPTGSCRYNWLPYASSTPLILVRQLTPNPDYAEATLFYEGDPNDTGALAEHMGAYYPRSTYCSNFAWYRHRCTR